MAILDKLLEFADDVSVAAAAGTAVVGDVIDTGNFNKDLGAGEPLWLVLKTGATEIITGGTAGTIQFFLVSDALATLGSATVANCTLHATSASFVTDDSAANSDELNAGGNLLVIPLPHGVYERYLGVLCTIGTTTVTAGTVNAYITSQEPPASVTQYAQGSDH